MNPRDIADLTYVAIFALVPAAFISAVLAASRALRPSAPSEVKGMPYECGMDQVGRPWARFHIRYYYFGLLFVLFDVETVLLFAVATQFRAMRGQWMLVSGEVVMFVVFVVGALVYAWRTGALQWQ